MSLLYWAGDPNFHPKPGDLVRYSHGSTALAILCDPHANGWHGRQCMGGHVFISRPARITDTDRRTWVACASWRQETPEQAAMDIGLSQATVDAAPLPLSPRRLSRRPFVDTPGSQADEYEQRLESDRTYPGDACEDCIWSMHCDWFLRGLFVGLAGGLIIAMLTHQIVN